MDIFALIEKLPRKTMLAGVIVGVAGALSYMGIISPEQEGLIMSIAGSLGIIGARHALEKGGAK